VILRTNYSQYRSISENMNTVYQHLLEYLTHYTSIVVYACVEEFRVEYYPERLLTGPA
jgi:hypothetical protein